MLALSVGIYLDRRRLDRRVDQQNSLIGKDAGNEGDGLWRLLLGRELDGEGPSSPRFRHCCSAHVILHLRLCLQISTLMQQSE
jgi:hypothetical protein